MPKSGKWFQVFESKPYLITLGLAGVLVLMVGLGLMGMGLKPKSENIEIFETGVAPDAGPKTIFIDIGGAVVKPGIYELPGDSRVNDALVAAGGLADEADNTRISQNLNLAQKLTDGQKLYLPFKGEANQENPNKDTPSPGKGVSLNYASQSELETLWGIGPVTAQKIIDGRPYSRIEELLEKKIVKTNVYEAIKDLVTVL